MVDIINLRQRRKQQTRQTKAEKADQNRISHGRTKVEKKATKANHTLDKQRMDGHKLTSEDD